MKNYECWKDMINGSLKIIDTEDDLTIAKTLRRLGRSLEKNFSEDYIELLEIEKEKINIKNGVN